VWHAKGNSKRDAQRGWCGTARLSLFYDNGAKTARSGRTLDVVEFYVSLVVAKMESGIHDSKSELIKHVPSNVATSLNTCHRPRRAMNPSGHRDLDILGYVAIMHGCPGGEGCLIHFQFNFDTLESKTDLGENQLCGAKLFARRILRAFQYKSGPLVGSHREGTNE